MFGDASTTVHKEPIGSRTTRVFRIAHADCSILHSGWSNHYRPCPVRRMATGCMTVYAVRRRRLRPTARPQPSSQTLRSSASWPPPCEPAVGAGPRSLRQSAACRPWPPGDAWQGCREPPPSPGTDAPPGAGPGTTPQDRAADRARRPSTCTSESIRPFIQQGKKSSGNADNGRRLRPPGLGPDARPSAVRR